MDGGPRTVAGDLLTDRLQCPVCGTPLNPPTVVGVDADGSTVDCDDCGAGYEYADGVFDLVAEGRGVVDVQADYQSFVSDEERAAREVAGRALRDRLADAAGVTLEVASGMGGLFDVLATRTDASPIASDVSADALRQLRERLAAGDGLPEGPHAFVACDARALPFRDGSVDGVVSAGGFNNVTDAREALSEAARVLPEGGRLVGLNLFVDAVTPGENPYDLLPVAGDRQEYAVVELTR